jgi:protein SCO1/2
MNAHYLLAAVFLFAISGCEKKTPPPFKETREEPSVDHFARPMFTVPPFTLTERSGQAFDSRSLEGKIWVADFFFATCPGICAALSSQMQKLHAETAALAGVQCVSISTDELDTPEVLRDYAARHKADDRWSFLTGKKDAVFSICRDGFKLALADNTALSEKDKFIHSGMLILVDTTGKIRGYYDAVGPDADKNRARLLADIKRIITQQK